LSGQHARRASDGSLIGLERRAEIAFQRDRDREGGGLSRQLACEEWCSEACHINSSVMSSVIPAVPDVSCVSLIARWRCGFVAVALG
jgi:hypothetical protein